MLSFLSTFWMPIAMILGAALYFAVLFRVQDDRLKKMKAAAWFIALFLTVHLVKFPPASEGWVVVALALMTGWAFGRSYRLLGIL